MLDQDDLWLIEEVPIDEPSELLQTLPEIRQCLEPGRPTDGDGLRAILEHPRALSKAWRLATQARGRPRRAGGTLRAA